mmetsp:Transcript_38922/g.93058  ORF Transcript_38922/g.93058 Transcript_38922/m.93058 type:complete len:239 (+) Transcript_38922:61-777(+)
METLSPTSALICHSLHTSNQPPVAIVHEAHLNRRPSSKASTAPTEPPSSHGSWTPYQAAVRTADMVLRPPSSASSVVSCRRDSLDGYSISQDLKADGFDGNLRLLSEEEVAQRASSALSYFRTTREINRQARSAEEMEYALQKARQRRKSEELRPKQQMLALEATVETEMSDNEEHEETSPRMTLAERMGYGVKGKEVSKWKRAVKEKPKKSVLAFASIQAGSNDLLARLRQKRMTIE